MSTLAGCRIVVTRPVDQAGPTVDALRQAGAEVLALPALALSALAVSADMPPYPYALIFVSRHAVQFGAAQLAKHRAVPAFAVGDGTAEVLRQAGFTDVQVPAARQDSEGLLALPLLDWVAQRDVVLVRGESEAGGRTLIADTLRARGAHLHELVCYRRQPRPFSEAERHAFQRAAAGGAWVQVGSIESWHALRGNLAAEALAAVACWLAPHPRVAETVTHATGRRCEVVPFAPRELVAALARLHLSPSASHAPGV